MKGERAGTVRPNPMDHVHVGSLGVLQDCAHQALDTPSLTEADPATNGDAGLASDK